MSKQQFLWRGYSILAAIIASGFLFSFPQFTGTIFPFLGVCFQFTMLIVLLAMIIRLDRQQRAREAAKGGRSGVESSRGERKLS